MPSIVTSSEIEVATKRDEWNPTEWSKDIRTLPITEVCELNTWLDKYMRLELPRLTDSKMLLDVLARNSREYEGDLGVFGVE